MLLEKLPVICILRLWLGVWYLSELEERQRWILTSYASLLWVSNILLREMKYNVIAKKRSLVKYLTKKKKKMNLFIYLRMPSMNKILSSRPTRHPPLLLPTICIITTRTRSKSRIKKSAIPYPDVSTNQRVIRSSESKTFTFTNYHISWVSGIRYYFWIEISIIVIIMKLKIIIITRRQMIRWISNLVRQIFHRNAKEFFVSFGYWSTNLAFSTWSDRGWCGIIVLSN